MPKFTEKPLTEKTDSNTEYIPLDVLPSNFKPYKINELQVSGLRIADIKTLNRIVGDTSFEQVVSVYRNLVHNIDIEELIPVDFKAVMFFIAHQTDNTFALTLSHECPLEVDKDGVKMLCSHKFATEVTLFDLDYQELDSVQEEYEDLLFKPIRIREILYMRQLTHIISQDPEKEPLDYVLALLAMCSNYEIADTQNLELFEETYNKIMKLPGGALKELAKIFYKYDLDLNPIEIKCPKCEGIFRTKISLDYSKVYP